MVRIFTLSADGTIEDRILKRLYARIRIFEESVGELEVILGEVVSDIRNEFWPVNWPKHVHDYPSFCYPSLTAIGKGRMAFGHDAVLLARKRADALFVRSLKIHLACRCGLLKCGGCAGCLQGAAELRGRFEIPDGSKERIVDVEALVALYIAHVLGDIRSRLLKRWPGATNQEITVSMGFPLRIDLHPELRESYERSLWIGYRMSQEKAVKTPSTRHACDYESMVREHPMPGPERRPTAVVEESEAALNAVAKRSDVGTGLVLVFDVGAGATNASCLRLVTGQSGEKQWPYTTVSKPYGADECDRAVAELVARKFLGPVIESASRQLELVRTAKHNRTWRTGLAALGWKVEKDELASSLKSPVTELHRILRESIQKAFLGGFERNEAEWRNARVIFLGGGTLLDEIRREVTQNRMLPPMIEHYPEPLTIKLGMLDIKDDGENQDLDGRTYDQLLHVCYGLSIPAGAYIERASLEENQPDKPPDVLVGPVDPQKTADFTGAHKKRRSPFY